MSDIQILPFIKDYINLVDSCLKDISSCCSLSLRQKMWLCFCITGILLTNTVCWARYERMSFGGRLVGSLSWMFRRSKIDWNKLLEASIRSILRKYDVTNGTLELDDTERERSKNAKFLYKLGKQKDKKSSGFFNGQSILFLLLVTDKITLPVGFVFYQMDPALRAWQKKDKRLRKQGVAKEHRPAEPIRDPLYPTKNELALSLVASFKAHFGDIKVRSVNADALFGTSTFMDGVAELYPKNQVISQIRSNQKIRFQGVEYVVSKYFEGRAPIKSDLIIRGNKQEVIYYSSVIAEVLSHRKKRLIIAFKYESEESYRYMVAQNMTWRTHDVLECFTSRWLVEVFFQDWKMYEGWGQLTKHTGAEGSRQSLILSLLFDHCLLSHPTQAARIKDKLPLCTVGSLRDRLSAQSLVQMFEYILEQPEPKKYLEELVKKIEDVYVLRTSSKHMSGRHRKSAVP